MAGIAAAAGYVPTRALDFATKAYVDSKAGGSAGVPTYVQQTDPALSTSYIWYQTNASGVVVQVWTNYVAAGPTTYAADNFNRADSTSSLGATSSGSYVWTQQLGTWGIVSNGAYASSIPSEAVATVDDGHANFVYSLTVTNVQDGSCGLVFRYQDTQNFWLVYPNGTNGWSLLRKVSNGYTTVGTAAVAAASGDVVKVTANGSAITVTVNGTQRVAATDSTFASLTPKGMWAAGSSGPNARFDDVLVTSVS